MVPFELVVDEDDLWLLFVNLPLPTDADDDDDDDDLVAEATLALTPLAKLLNKSIFAAFFDF